MNIIAVAFALIKHNNGWTDEWKERPVPFFQKKAIYVSKYLCLLESRWKNVRPLLKDITSDDTKSWVISGFLIVPYFTIQPKLSHSPVLKWLNFYSPEFVPK